MSKNIIFDRLGAQVQVAHDGHPEDSSRLDTLLTTLQDEGFNVKFTIDDDDSLSSQLDGNKLFISTTRQYSGIDHSNVNGLANFSYVRTFETGFVQNELKDIQDWLHEGNSILYFTNHNAFHKETGPFWPVNDIQLAATFGITLSFATFTSPTGNLNMTVNPSAPAELIDGVKSVQAFDSGGICTKFKAPNLRSTTLVPLPENCSDTGILGYDKDDFAFAVLYEIGLNNGKIIFMGHSGIVGNDDTGFPSNGQIGSGDNLRFIMNCINFLTKDIEG